MEPSPLEAQILEMMLSEPSQEATVYSLFKKGTPRSSAHRGLQMIEAKGLASSRREQGKRIFSLTSQGLAVSKSLHVPQPGGMSTSPHWIKSNWRESGTAYSNLGGGDAKVYLRSNEETKEILPLPSGYSMIMSATSASIVFQATSGTPVTRYDPLCRKCGGKLRTIDTRVFCPCCDNLP